MSALHSIIMHHDQEIAPITRQMLLLPVKLFKMSCFRRADNSVLSDCAKSVVGKELSLSRYYFNDLSYRT